MLCCLSLALLQLAACELGEHIELRELSFDAYLQRYGKSYSGSEYAMRQVLFERRRAEAEALNARPGVLWTAGLTELSDLHEGELRQRMGYNKALRAGSADDGTSNLAGFSMQGMARAQPPAHVDWREHSPVVVSPVKQQGGCGSCWAFSAAESIESHVALSTGKLLSLSPQQLNSCTPNPQHCGGGGGCSGATAQLAFNYTVQAGGLSEIWDYPYTSGGSNQNEKCLGRTSLAVAMITGFVQLPRNNAAALLEAVWSIGPISVTVDATNWFPYRRGIFDHCNRTHPDLNHAVQLVGYGEWSGTKSATATKYWLIRNSWGVVWGEDGYMRLRRHSVEPCSLDVTPQHGYSCKGGPSSVEACGECGVLSDSAYPSGASFGYIWEERRLQEATTWASAPAVHV